MLLALDLTFEQLHTHNFPVIILLFFVLLLHKSISLAHSRPITQPAWLLLSLAEAECVGVILPFLQIGVDANLSGGLGYAGVLLNRLVSHLEDL